MIIRTPFILLNNIPTRNIYTITDNSVNVVSDTGYCSCVGLGRIVGTNKYGEELCVFCGHPQLTVLSK